MKKLGLVLALLAIASPALGQSNYSNTAGIRAYDSSVDANKVKVVAGSVTVVPSGTQNVNVTQVGGNAVTTTLPVSDAGGSLTVDGTVAVSNFPATQPVSGTVAATQSGTWNVGDITGTVSLPTGASTSALQTTGNSSLSSIDTKLSGTLAVSGPLTDTQLRATAVPVSVSGVATAANQATANASLSSIDTKLTSPLTISLPTGASTAANQTATQGSVAPGTAATASMLTGGVYNSSGVTLTNGQQAATQLDSTGGLRVFGAAVSGAGGGNNMLQVGGQDAGFTYRQIRTDTSGALKIFNAPTTDSNAAITPTVTSAVASNLVAKSSAGNLYGFQVTSGASAGYALLFNATSLPADGAVTPIKCYSMAATSTLSVDFRPGPALRFGTGLVIGFSTTGCFTLTASATAFISAEVQ